MHILQINRPARRKRGHVVALLATLMLLTGIAVDPGSAVAGSYVVSGTCAWEPYNQAAASLAVYPDGGDPGCPGRAARNVYGHFNTAAGPAAGWQFIAPGGASITHLAASNVVTAQAGWQAGIVSNRVTLFNCSGGSCPQLVTGDWNLANDSVVATRVRCGSTGGCYNGDASGYLRLLHAQVTVADGTPPSIYAGGDAAGTGWKGGTRQLVIEANDNVGVKYVRALVDGAQVADRPRSCDYRQKAPCPNGADTISVPLGGVSEGPHRLTAQAVDSADNWAGTDRTIHVDNTAPVSPVGTTVAGGAGWRSQNAWKISWTNPPQVFAPIAGARYSVCPPAADSQNPVVAAKAKKACVTGGRDKQELTEITDLELPEAGEWTLRLWLVDAAGNADRDTAATISGLGYDPTPPEVAGFAEQDPSDPARVFVKASDTDSPIASGTIEVRRHGSRAWRPLATEVRGGGISAFVDDEALRKGRYQLRATVVNAAGLQQGTDHGTDGNPKSLKLPIRIASHLIAGKPAGRICTHRHRTRRCPVRLRRHPGVAIGRRTLLRGRLIAHGKPIRRQPLEVWQRLSTIGASWHRIGSVETGKTGRFRYTARRGPARALRFRYPGTAHVRGDNANVKLRVRARTTLQLNRRRVINGEYVTFSGQLKGGWRPAAGVLVELQVRSRGTWRTFAQPRADGPTGRWTYQYRFETVRAGARFRFRARVRRQAGYPFAPGHSRTIHVSVRGL